MTTRRLLWGITSRGIAGGAIAGLLLGAMYGVVLAVYSLASDSYLFGARSGEYLIGNVAIIGIGGFVGGLAGFGLGFFLGLVGGFFLGALTRWFFFAKERLTRYVLLVRVAALGFGLIGAPLAIVGLEILRSGLFGGRWAFSITLVYHIIPGLIGGFAAMLVGGRIARWYEKEIRKQSL